MGTSETIPTAGPDQRRMSATHQTFQAMGVRHATWLELFFDLVFVAVIGIVAHGLAHTDHGEIESKRLVSFFAVIVPTLWVWAGHTLFANRYDIDSNWQRACAIVMMGFVLLMSPYIESVQGTGYGGVVLCYLAMQGVLALAYFTAPSTTPEGDALARGIGAAIVAGMAVSASSLLIDAEWKFALFYGGILVQFAPDSSPERQGSCIPGPSQASDRTHRALRHHRAGGNRHPDRGSIRHARAL